MSLQRIEIQKLFGQFDYNIPLNQEEGVTILTGPNGYGKTTILKIIYNFFKQNFFFFQRLNFERITFHFHENKNVEITKTKHEIEKLIQVTPIGLMNAYFIEVSFTLKVEEKAIEKFIFNSNAEDKLFQSILQLNPNIGRAPGNRLLHLNTQRLIDIEDYILQLPQKPLELMGSKNNPINNLFSTLSSIGVYLIKEQRRLESINIPGMFTDPQMRSFSHKIQRYAIELGNLIHQKQMAAYQESQKLDSSFPSRLIQLGRRLSQSEFDDRLKVLSKKQQQLQQYGIAISNIQMPKYDKNNENDVKVLSIYLEDSEKKACFFDDLVAKINLFVDIINKKDFSLNKKININGNSGFSFETNQGEKLNLALLSSGEQEEVILLYELIFRARPNTLVLIDEPETSLHVTWQKEFVNDLFAIAKLQPISFLLATHSPSIVDGRWDIAPDLFDLANGEEDLEND